jgi:nucleoside 2-deoxyribosyltransferase
VTGRDLYLASPLGFSEPGRHYAITVLMPRLAEAGWTVLDPWVDEGGVIAVTMALPAGEERVAALERMSRLIGERNRSLIGRADVVLAILDGPDVDSGTAAEIGWAAAHGKPVVGWRSDFRLAEHEASRINIQVADFITVSGGGLVTTLDEAVAVLSGLA